MASGYRQLDTGQGLVLMGLARDTSGWQRREVRSHPCSQQVASWVGVGSGLPGDGGCASLTLARERAPPTPAWAHLLQHAGLVQVGCLGMLECLMFQLHSRGPDIKSEGKNDCEVSGRPEHSPWGRWRWFGAWWEWPQRLQGRQQVRGIETGNWILGETCSPSVMDKPAP